MADHIPENIDPIPVNTDPIVDPMPEIIPDTIPVKDHGSEPPVGAAGCCGCCTGVAPATFCCATDWGFIVAAGGCTGVAPATFCCADSFFLVLLVVDLMSDLQFVVSENLLGLLVMILLCSAAPHRLF